MSVNTNSTVMGPEGVLSTSNCNTNNAPRFETGKTDKLRYRDALHKCSTMIRKLAKVDRKFNGILDTIGIMIYMSCDQSAQDVLTRAEKNGTLNLERDDKHDDRSQLINKNLDIIAEDSQHDRITREIKLMKELIEYERKPDEKISSFIIGFNTVVSLYTNNIGTFSSKMTIQCVSLLFKNQQTCKRQLPRCHLPMESIYRNIINQKAN